MLTEEQVQIIEKELKIERETRPDGLCVFGLYDEGKGCRRPAVTYLPSTADDVDGGRPEILHICQYHADVLERKIK